MAKMKPIIIATLGARGGSGKSTLAHLLAIGAAANGRPVFLFETDKSRPSMAALDTSPSRPYAVVDGLNRENPDDLEYFANLFNRYVTEYQDVEGATFIIDGAAAREDFDGWVANSANVVLVSANATEHDMLALNQSWPLLSQNKNAHIILTKTWKSEGWIKDRSQFISKFPAKPVIGIPQHEIFAHLSDSVYRPIPSATSVAKYVFAIAEKLAKYD